LPAKRSHFFNKAVFRTQKEKSTTKQGPNLTLTQPKGGISVAAAREKIVNIFSGK
jgi:hypothetical protein